MLLKVLMFGYSLTHHCLWQKVPMAHLAATHQNYAGSGKAANCWDISEASRTYLDWKGLLLGHPVKLFALFTGFTQLFQAIPDGWVSSLALKNLVSQPLSWQLVPLSNFSPSYIIFLISDQILSSAA